MNQELNTALGLALQLQALQLLEDSGNTCGMHPKTIRRGLIERLVDKTSEVDAEVPPGVVGIDPAAGDDMAVVQVRHGDEMVAMFEITGGDKKANEALAHELSGKLSAHPEIVDRMREAITQHHIHGTELTKDKVAHWARRLEEVIFGGPEAAQQQRYKVDGEKFGESMRKDDAAWQRELRQRASTPAETAGNDLHAYSPKGGTARGDDVEFRHNTNGSMEVTIIKDRGVTSSTLVREHFTFDPSEPLASVHAFMVGVVEAKHGPVLADALNRKLRISVRKELEQLRPQVNEQAPRRNAIGLCARYPLGVAYGERVRHLGDMGGGCPPFVPGQRVLIEFGDGRVTESGYPGQYNGWNWVHPKFSLRADSDIVAFTVLEPSAAGGMNAAAQSKQG